MERSNTEQQVIPMEQCLDMIGAVVAEYGLKPSQEDMFNTLCMSVPVFEVDGEVMVTVPSMRQFMTNFGKAVTTGDSSFFRQKTGISVDRVVDIEEFAESPDYMAQAGYLRPVIKYELIRLFENPDEFVEVVATGAIGIGKNYFADIALAYMIYLLSCYHNPQMEHGLAPGSSIVFIQQSMTQTLAKKVVFDQFSERLKISPYFTSKFMFDTNVKSELRFPKNVYVLPVGGSDTAAIGMNVYGGIIDELNFMQRTQNSLMTKYTGEDEYDQAERLYRQLIRRIKSRFMQRGKVPGKLLLISSVNYPGDFTDRKIDEAKKDPTIFVMKYSQWEALPEERFCGEKFPVEVGNEVKQSKILKDISEARDEEDVIMVPVEYKTEFERNLEEALRDLAGVATGTKHPFIPQRELIKLAQDEHAKIFDGNQLFLRDKVILSDLIDADSPDWELLVNMDYLSDYITDPSVIHTCHIDIALTGDAAGLAISHIAGYKMLPAFKYYDERTQGFVEVRDVRAPIYCVDGVLQINAPMGDEVDLELIRDLVLFIRGHILIQYATMDSYQSAMMIQAFRKAKMRSGVLSVDTSIAPYAEVKQSIKDERLWLPVHEVTARELREIEKDPKKDKIDHPDGGSKDCSDAVAGSVYILHSKCANYAGRRSRRRQTAEPNVGVRKIRTARSSSSTRRKIRGGTV